MRRSASRSLADFLADLVASMAIADVSAQMWRRIVERELGYYCGALRRKVSVIVFAGVMLIIQCFPHSHVQPPIFLRTFLEIFRDSVHNLFSR